MKKGGKLKQTKQNQQDFFYDCFEIFQDLHIYLDAKRVGISSK